MKLSTRGKYGLYAMVFLAQHAGEGPQTLKAIADFGLPEQYLEQLLGSLRRGGLVQSARGAQGGYQLSRPPEEITLLHIMDVMEGPLTLSECVTDGEHQCPMDGKCPSKGALQYLTDSINHLFAGITLKDLIDKSIRGDRDNG